MRTVILKHTLKDNSWHHDWLIQIEPDSSARVATFRTAHRRPDLEPTFEAERIGDHRSIYLDYEGEVSGERGRVERLLAGEVSRAQWGADRIELELVFDGAAIHLIGERESGQFWRFVRV